MPLAAARNDAGRDVVALVRGAAEAVDALLSDAKAKVRARVVVEGRAIDRLIDREQRATHGLAWIATYVEAVRQFRSYAIRMSEAGRLGELEELLIRIGIGEYLAQIFGGVPVRQGEIVRPAGGGMSTAQAAQ